MMTRPTRSLLAVLMMASLLAAPDAATVSHEPERDACYRTSCIPAGAGDKNADFVFVRTMTHDDDDQKKSPKKPPKKPKTHWDMHGGFGKDMDRHYGPDPIPPGARPPVVHTGSGKDIFPGPVAADHYCPVPTAVPVPAAAWLLISGIAGLGLGAWRRKRS